MSKLYLVPDISDMDRESRLAKEYDCAFEYNDFYAPNVLEHQERQEEIVTYYSRHKDSFAQDTIHGAFLDVTIHSDDPRIRDASMLRVRQSMEIAGRMRAKGVIFHTGRLAGFRVTSYLHSWLDRNAAFFTQIALEYPKQQIYMENMFDEAPDILAKLAERMRGVPNFGICLDYAHAMLSKHPPEEWIRELAPYLRHMHINDNDLENDLHLPVGSGRVDWQEFDRLMRLYRIDVPVLVEVKGYDAQADSLNYMKRCGIYPMDKERER